MISFDLHWVDAIDAGDPLERSSWAQLAVRLAESTATRVYDRAAKSERDAIFVPLYPLARWIVDQWWSLLYEPWPSSEDLPAPGRPMSAEVRAWVGRHCLRVAIPGYATPFTCIYSQGNAMALSTRPDPRGRYIHTSVEFRESADGSGERESLRLELARLVACVLERIEGVADARVAALRTDWQAICSASAQEAEFCRAAGRLGLDPYVADAWPGTLLDWFERTPGGELDQAFVTDLLETPDPSAAKPVQHAVLRQVIDELDLRAATEFFGPPAKQGTPFHDGYALAGWVRSQMHLTETQALKDLREAAEAACSRALVVPTVPKFPEGRVLGLVGWNSAHAPVVAARRSGRDTTDRFVRARGLYLALRAAVAGPRLVTDARTWDQRASRAFGAELLAPRAGVLQRFAEAEARFGRDEALVQVADHYRVSSKNIEHQLDNSSNLAA